MVIAVASLYLATPYLAAPSIEIHDPYGRITPKVIGVYMMIHNHGFGQDCLVGAEMISPMKMKAEIHRTIMSNGVARMEPVSSICIPGRSEVELEPGGYHIMIMGNYTEIIDSIKEIVLILHFQRSGDIRITVPIKETAPESMHTHQQS
ncbi:MAG TPA: copper chaperone PCu(A)C [Sulfolobales archaeon]|nr:copper chaperone PCu(A)C [Sulfolobales archaeon]